MGTLAEVPLGRNVLSLTFFWTENFFRIIPLTCPACLVKIDNKYI